MPPTLVEESSQTEFTQKVSGAEDTHVLQGVNGSLLCDRQESDICEVEGGQYHNHVLNQPHEGGDSFKPGIQPHKPP